ncbi:unnamed protein product [Linum tenue]|uniref:DUF4283 domain-containing protein n=1 Tax=Linum tenue TaxID=586396 RepID=A0AAV0Q205_9ROSI|nr:unnamed protein product [Linum tenue]
MDEWYIAESDSEDIAAAIREDGQEAPFEADEDPKCPPIQFSAVEERTFCRELRSALIVKALGRSVSYTAMSIRLNAIWAKAGGIQVTSMKKGYFLIRFTSGLDYERAITGGPWMIGPSYLTVHMWDKHFDPYEHEISSTVVWARLLDLPIHYFHHEAVMKIGRRMGKPIRIDAATRTKARSDYARVCVQVDFTKPLLSQFTINGKKYFIQYEGLEKICLSCGTYSEHGACPWTKAHIPMEADSNVAVHQTGEKEPKQDSTYGEWMIAKRKPRPPHKEQATQSLKGGAQLPQGKSSKQSSATGSRFGVLQEEDRVESSARHENPVILAESGVTHEVELPKGHMKHKNKTQTHDAGNKKNTPMHAYPTETSPPQPGPLHADQPSTTPRCSLQTEPISTQGTGTDVTPPSNVRPSEGGKDHPEPRPGKIILGEKQPSKSRVEKPPDQNAFARKPHKGQADGIRNQSAMMIDGVNPSEN